MPKVSSERKKKKNKFKEKKKNPYKTGGRFRASKINESGTKKKKDN
jgi:hypothetical protein